MESRRLDVGSEQAGVLATFHLVFGEFDRILREVFRSLLAEYSNEERIRILDWIPPSKN